MRTSEDKQVSFKLPLAIDQRLEALLERAMEAGDNTNRREVLSALILDSNPTGDELREMLRLYRTVTVGEALLDQPLDATDVVELATHKPGPRSAKN